MMSMNYINEESKTYQEIITQLKEKEKYYQNKTQRLERQLKQSEQKRLKAIEYIKKLLDNTDDIICYGIDRHCKETLLEILGDDE